MTYSLEPRAGHCGKKARGCIDMKTIEETGLLFGRYARQVLRNPVWLVASLTTPILYLALFTPLLRHLGGRPLSAGTALDLFLPGILALVAFGSGVGPGFSLIFDVKAGVVERLRVTPANRFAILMGPILVTVVMMYIFDAILLVVGGLFGFHIHPAGLAVLAILLALLEVTTAAFFSATSLRAKGDINGFAAIANGLNLPVLLLGGVLLPLSLGPLWLRDLGHVDPLYYVASAARVLAAGQLSSHLVWHAFLILVPLCALVLIWATRVLRRVIM